MASINELQTIETKIDIQSIRADFPILKQVMYGDKPLVYLDSAATSQKPQIVIDAHKEYYENDNANVHRGIYALAHRATLAYEGAREKVRSFLNAGSNKEIIFTGSTTDAINLVAASWGRKNLTKGDVILLTEMEHHSNVVPWQIVAKEVGAEIQYIPFTESGELDQIAFGQMLDSRVKLLALTHMSNVLGTINPVAEMIRSAHRNGSLVLVDGAQSAAHMAVDVQALDVDFYAISGHKMMGPTGTGALYAKEELLQDMPPVKGGGEMIHLVKKEYFTTADLPHKFEAGTPNIGGAIALGVAVDYLNKIGMDTIHQQEQTLLSYALDKMPQIAGMNIYGDPKLRGGIISFNVADIHPHDLSQVLDQYGVAIRSGHHCAQIALAKLGVESTNRVSFYVYNKIEEIDVLVDALQKSVKLF